MTTSGARFVGPNDCPICGALLSQTDDSGRKCLNCGYKRDPEKDEASPKEDQSDEKVSDRPPE